MGLRVWQELKWIVTGQSVNVQAAQDQRFFIVIWRVFRQFMKLWTVLHGIYKLLSA